LIPLSSAKKSFHETPHGSIRRRADFLMVKMGRDVAGKFRLPFGTIVPLIVS